MNKREVVVTEISRNCQSIRLIGSYRDKPEETWSASVEVMPDKQLIVRTKLHNDARREADGNFVTIPESIQEEMKQEARYALGLEERPVEESLKQVAPSMEFLQMPLL
ncbi:MAG TPA: hypothetical protein VJH70_01820 [Candidatus Paceibacterota bacterium]